MIFCDLCKQDIIDNKVVCDDCYERLKDEIRKLKEENESLNEKLGFRISKIVEKIKTFKEEIKK